MALRKNYPKGSDHPMWRGGVKTNTQGYKLIYSPDHPYKDKQGYVREHRLVMEKEIGRYLLPNEVVHHLNNVKDDNRIDNLQVLLKREHDYKSIHERPLKGSYRVCPICRRKFYIPPSLNRVKTCSKSCGIKFRWIVGGKESFNR